MLLHAFKRFISFYCLLDTIGRQKYVTYWSKSCVVYMKEWVKTRRGRGQLYMLAIDVAQLVINKNCIKSFAVQNLGGACAPCAPP